MKKSAEETTEFMKQSSMTPKELQKTTPLPGQEWCAYTYLLLPEPQNNVYGVIKIVGFAESEDELRQLIAAMFDSGELEENLPFVRIRKTGFYSYIVPGNDREAETLAYNTEDNEYVGEAQRQLAEREKKSIKSIQRQMKKLKKESQYYYEDDPESYEVYAQARAQEESVTSWLKQQEKIIAEQKKNLVKASKRRKDLARRFPLYPRRFDAEAKGDYSLSGDQDE